jgi:hypothetical protein
MAQQADQSRPLLAMIALNSPALPPVASLTRSLKAIPEIAVDLGSVQAKDNGLVLGLGNDRAIVALMPMPIPWSNLEGPCATAWWWPEASEKVQQHTSHLLVMLAGDTGNLIQRHLTLTHLTAAVASLTDAVGIYWSGGTLVHRPQDFIDEAQNVSDDNLPLHLWIDFRIEQNEDGSYRLFTTGMKALGQMEIEIAHSTKTPEEIVHFAHSVAGYLITSNPRIDSGETIGRSQAEKIPATRAPSMFDATITVLRLDY